MVYDLWNEPMLSIATEELKYERGHLPPPPPTLLILNEVWALGTYEYFKAFPVVLEKIGLTVSKCFHVCTHKSFAYYHLQQNQSKFLDYISESFLRNGISWIVGDLAISCLHDTRVQINQLVWVFNLCVARKIVYLFCLNMSMLNKTYFYVRSAENFEILLLQWPKYLTIL